MPRGGADGSVLKRDLAAGRVAAVYLLYGEEAYLKEEAVATLRRALFGEVTSGEALWNLTVLEGGSSSLSDILDAARTLPMLAPRRLVLVKEAEKLRETDADPLRTYLKKPSPTSCLAFVTGTGKPDFRRAVFKTLQEGATSVEFRPLRGASIRKWIRERARERGAEIEEEAASLLEVHLGNDLIRMDQEMDKALQFLAPSRRITLPALGETLGAPVTGSVFELAERIAAGEMAGAVLLVRRLLADGEEPSRILFLIARQIRILILGQGLVKAGRRGRDLAVALGIPPLPFVLEKTQGLIARFPEEAGPAALRRILEADRSLKGGAGKGPTLLEGLVFDLVELMGRARGSTGPGSGAVQGRTGEART